MKPRIVRLGAFHVVGVRERFVPGRIERIPVLWDEFIRRAATVPHRIDGVHYGVCVDATDRATGEKAFLYTAGVGVESVGEVPEGMSATTVPAATYAVFTHRGSIRDFGRTVQAIWREWIPASGLVPTRAPDFERYDERFRMDADDSEVDVYVPVTATI
jgi:AraC family transcriptional regulator